MPSPNSSPNDSTPDNATPDNATPDNATPDNATPDNATPDNSKAHAPPTPGSPTPAPDKALSNAKSPSFDGIDEHKAIVGGAIGVGFVLLMLVIVCIIKSRRKKRKQRPYYGQPSHGKGQNPPTSSNILGQNQLPQHQTSNLPLHQTGNLLIVNEVQNICPSGNYYSREDTHPNMHSGPRSHGAEHVVKVHQSANGMGPPSSVWGAPPTVNSSDMSSNYSMGGYPLPPPSPGSSLKLSGGLGRFTYEELASATGGFAKDNIVGQGGFGYVYKGVLPNGKAVAVKTLKSGSGQGDREFQAEIEIINRVHHRHLVSLVGHCSSGGQRMLVYEFVPNKTLEHHLHGKGVPTMNWPTRMKIAIGSAKGLAYLHEDCDPRIIHRDIKASNVLLDDSFEAKVSDFGLAKLTNVNDTHVSTRVMGTFGYLAPEYAASGKLTEKSDVFSFGVMLLELISGKRPLDLTNTMDESLVEWARPLLTRGLEGDGNFGELVDPFLEGNYNTREMTRMAACASASIRHSGKKRPKMSQIVRTLEGDASLDDLKSTGGSNPFNSSSASSEYNTMQYQADIMKFRMAIMSSQEFGESSELSSNEISHR